MLMDAEVATPMFPDWSMGFEYVDDEEIANDLDGFTAATTYPLVNPDPITNAGVAQTLLSLYAKNRVRSAHLPSRPRVLDQPCRSPCRSPGGRLFPSPDTTARYARSTKPSRCCSA